MNLPTEKVNVPSKKDYLPFVLAHAFLFRAFDLRTVSAVVWSKTKSRKTLRFAWSSTAYLFGLWSFHQVAIAAVGTTVSTYTQRCIGDRAGWAAGQVDRRPWWGRRLQFTTTEPKPTFECLTCTVDRGHSLAPTDPQLKAHPFGRKHFRLRPGR